MSTTSPATYRAAHAARMREYRARTGLVRTARVDLGRLGEHLEVLERVNPDAVALLTVILGEDVIRRARVAAAATTDHDTTEPARGVAR